MPLVLESFDRPIPDAPHHTIHRVSPMAAIPDNSTKRAEPPKIGIAIPYATWDRYASNLLDSTRVYHELTGVNLAPYLRNSSFESEADVADAAAAQLLDPVDLVLGARWPKSMFFSSQRTVTHTNRVWRMRTHGGAGSTQHTADKYIAVLNFKRPGIIQASEFESAMMGWNEYSLALERRSGRLDNQFTPSTSSDNNAHVLMKQAVAYSHEYGTKFVAFFDWNRLVLVVLVAAKGTVGGNHCYMTIVSDRYQIRRALVGFLARAYESCRLDGADSFGDVLGVKGAASGSARGYR